MKYIILVLYMLGYALIGFSVGMVISAIIKFKLIEGATCYALAWVITLALIKLEKHI